MAFIFARSALAFSSFSLITLIIWNIMSINHELLVRAFGTDLSNLSQTCHLPHLGCSRRRCHLLAASRRLCEEAQQRAMKQQARRSAAHNMAQHWAPFLPHFRYSNNSVILTFQSHHHIRLRHATFPSLIKKNYWLPLPIAWKKRISLSRRAFAKLKLENSNSMRSFGLQ